MNSISLFVGIRRYIRGVLEKKVLSFDAVSNSPYVSQEELADYC